MASPILQPVLTALTGLAVDVASVGGLVLVPYAVSKGVDYMADVISNRRRLTEVNNFVAPDFDADLQVSDLCPSCHEPKPIDDLLCEDCSRSL